MGDKNNKQAEWQVFIANGDPETAVKRSVSSTDTNRETDTKETSTETNAFAILHKSE